MRSMTAISLPLDIREQAIGRKSAKTEPWQLVYERDIVVEDLALLASQTRMDVNQKAPLAKIRDPHHALAREIAKGTPDIQISALYGYAPARIRTLKEDPAFRELVVHYQTEAVFQDADIDAQIKHVGLLASQELQERLETEPESFSTKELLEMRNSSLDRIGKGPTAKLRVENDTSRVLEELRTLMAQEARGRVISKAQVIDAESHEVDEHVQAPLSEGTEDRQADADGAVQQ